MYFTWISLALQLYVILPKKSIRILYEHRHSLLNNLLHLLYFTVIERTNRKKDGQIALIRPSFYCLSFSRDDSLAERTI